MACPKNLRTDLLTSAQAGGTWTYNGVSSTVAGTPTAPTNAPTSGGNPLVFNNVISGGDNPSVTTDNADIGFHVFTYDLTLNGCQDTEEVRLQVLPAVDAGGDFTLTLCENGNQVVIYDEWVNNGNAPTTATAATNDWATAAASAGYTSGNTNDITDDTFDPNQSGTGTFNYVFIITQDGQEAGYTINCPDCTKTATVTINVVSAPNAGTAQMIAVCNSTT